MYFNETDRDTEYQTKLCGFIEYQYEIKIINFNAHTRGWYGETWKAETTDKDYFVKICYSTENKRNFAKCFRVLNYMRSRNIDYVLKPLATKTGFDYCAYNDGILGVFDFVNGEHTENYPLENLIEQLIGIYSLPPPSNVEQEEFDFGKIYADYEERLYGLNKLNKYNDICTLIKRNIVLLQEIRLRAQKYEAICKKETSKRCITSGDVGGNVIVNSGKMTIVDWDYIVLAPVERDLWFYACKYEQIDFINKIFKNHGFNYVLSENKLGYYANSRFFYYISEAIDCILFNPKSYNEVLDWFKNHFDRRGFEIGIIDQIEKHAAKRINN